MLDVSVGSVFACAVPVVDGGSAARGLTSRRSRPSDGTQAGSRFVSTMTAACRLERVYPEDGRWRVAFVLDDEITEELQVGQPVAIGISEWNWGSISLDEVSVVRQGPCAAPRSSSASSSVPPSSPRPRRPHVLRLRREPPRARCSTACRSSAATSARCSASDERTHAVSRLTLQPWARSSSTKNGSARCAAIPHGCSSTATHSSKPSREASKRWLTPAMRAASSAGIDWTRPYIRPSHSGLAR